MAASAEYELEKRVERLELFPVELEKGERPGPGRVGLLSGASFSPGPVSTPQPQGLPSSPKLPPPFLCAPSVARFPKALQAASWAVCWSPDDGKWLGMADVDGTVASNYLLMCCNRC